MPPLKTATRAALRCSNSLSYFFIPYQADLPPSDYHHHKVEVHYKGNWKESGFPQKLNLQSTSLDTTTFATTTTLATTSTTTTAAPPLDPSTHVFLTLALLVLFTGLLVGLAAVGLVMKTRWDRYHVHMMPLYQFERDQVVTREMADFISFSRTTWKPNCWTLLKSESQLAAQRTGGTLAPVRCKHLPYSVL